jgi:hypothetical protein
MIWTFLKKMALVGVAGVLLNFAAGVSVIMLMASGLIKEGPPPPWLWISLFASVLLVLFGAIPLIIRELFD